MSTLDEEDRREYYRIEDTIALEIRPLSAADAAGKDVLQDASPLFNLLSELHLSEFESQHLLRQVNERDRALSAYLKSQNKRIDLLSQVMAINLLGEIGELQSVILSEGGIEFSHNMAYPTGTHPGDQAGADATGSWPAAAGQGDPLRTTELRLLRNRHRIRNIDRRPAPTAGALYPAKTGAATAPGPRADRSRGQLSPGFITRPDRITFP